jgi:hypothetical protein
MGNKDAGWAEETDQSKSLTGFRSGADQERLAMVRSLVVGKGTRLLGRDTEPGFTLTALLARYGLPDNLRRFTAYITESVRIDS